ncbi:MAG: ABC transporter ATP-binding protein/permease [Methanomassiliicoccaceae archaeon]|nr:ABC transporter ATP-binding protein/permease [Methanomassiliicoccaceae archaeon]
MNLKLNNILKYLTWKEWTLIAVIFVLNIFQVWFNLRIPQDMFTMMSSGAIVNGPMSQVYSLGQDMLLCAFGSLAMVIVISFIAARIAATMSRRMRSMMFNRVESYSMGDINKFSIASLITRSTNDVTQVQMVLTMGLQLIMYAPMLAIWAFIRIAGGNIEWTLITAAAMISIVVLFAVIIVMVVPRFKKMQTLTDNVNRVTRENLTGLPVIRAYNAEGYQEAKFEKANQELVGTQLYTTHAFAVMMPFVSFIMSALVLGVYWIGAILIHNTGVGLEAATLYGSMTEFSSYIMQVMLAVMLILMIFIMMPRAQVAARRIYEVINTDPTIKDGEGKEPDSSLRGDIEFRNVGFKYPGAADYVLKDVSFTAKQGETIAFIGSTGSGKSTLINLLPRFYDVTEGSVMLDGVDVRDYKLESLYNKIGYIPQKSILFSGTVSSNVAFGEKEGEQSTEEDVRNAVRIAQGADFIEEMEGTYDASIARGGTNLSGGQKQRLSIARAVCRAPEVYIFDDSFSALDYKTDRALRTALKKETKGVTSMIVAQRIGTIMDADKIVVLDEGRVVGVGNHRELLKTCGVYRDIATSQLSEEELAI